MITTEQDTKRNTDFILNQWVPALRSGKYRQGFTVLHAPNDTYCCLGVACDLIANDETVPGVIREVAIDGMEPTSGREYLPTPVARFIGIGVKGEGISPSLDDYGSWASLSEANDDLVPFADLADALEADARQQLDS